MFVVASSSVVTHVPLINWAIVLLEGVGPDPTGKISAVNLCGVDGIVKAGYVVELTFIAGGT